MQKIKPCLWFKSDGEEAMRFYVSVFGDGEVTSVTPGPDGTMIMGAFRLRGQEFLALNGAGDRAFTEAISLFVACESQAEIDHFWEAFIADGGEESRCGWLTDKYGVSWQIIPDALGDYLGGPDCDGAKRATEAMLTMRKLDVETLRRAYEGEGK